MKHNLIDRAIKIAGADLKKSAKLKFALTDYGKAGSRHNLARAYWNTRNTFETLRDSRLNIRFTHYMDWVEEAYSEFLKQQNGTQNQSSRERNRETDF